MNPKKPIWTVQLPKLFPKVAKHYSSTTQVAILLQIGYLIGHKKIKH